VDLELAGADGNARTTLAVERGPEPEKVVSEPAQNRFWTKNKKTGCFAFVLVALLASCILSPLFFARLTTDGSVQ
jgi:hypothetical protein